MSKRPKRKTLRRFDCHLCKQYMSCDAPCPKAEAYANKDVVNQKEETIGIPVITRPPNLCVREGISLTAREHEIFTLLEIHGFSRQETAKYLKITMESLRTHLKNIRRKIPPKPS